MGLVSRDINQWSYIRQRIKGLCCVAECSLQTWKALALTQLQISRVTSIDRGGELSLRYRFYGHIFCVRPLLGDTGPWALQRIAKIAVMAGRNLVIVLTTTFPQIVFVDYSVLN